MQNNSWNVSNASEGMKIFFDGLVFSKNWHLFRSENFIVKHLIDS